MQDIYLYHHLFVQEIRYLFKLFFIVINMASSESLSALKERIAVLEDELLREKSKNGSVVRQKISQMSSEVVDSNPYR